MLSSKTIKQWRATRATFLLATVLVSVFVLEITLGAAGNERALLRLGALRTRDWSAADSWRVLTFSFLHLTWVHLAMNLILLVWLGRIVERRLGSTAFVAIVAAAGAASGTAGMLLGSFLPTTGVAIGASGVMFGLLAAALLLAFRRQPGQGSEGNGRLQRPLLICFIVAIGISFVPGVSLAGHIGGFAGGALMGWMLMSRSPDMHAKRTPRKPRSSPKHFSGNEY